MELNRIVSGVPNSIFNNPSTEGTPKEGNFLSFFQDAMLDTVSTDAVDKTSNIDAVAGTLDDLHSATIAADKAEIALRLTIQLRNKAVEAYTEIMRMSM